MCRIFLPNRSGDDVYLAIKRASAESRLGAGEYLRETQLAKSLGVSRSSVRVKTCSWQDAHEIFEAHLLIEPLLAGRAAAYIDTTTTATKIANTARASISKSSRCWHSAMPNGQKPSPAAIFSWHNSRCSPDRKKAHCHTVAVGTPIGNRKETMETRHAEHGTRRSKTR